MKYYARRIFKRMAIHRFGRLGFVPCFELFKTKDPSFVEVTNRRKRFKFEETNDPRLRFWLETAYSSDYVYTITEEDYNGIVLPIPEDEEDEDVPNWARRKDCGID